MSPVTGPAHHCSGALPAACPSPSQSGPLLCGMSQMTVCWCEFMKEGKNFPRSPCRPVLGDQVSREGPADAPTLGRADRGHLDLTIPGRGRRAWDRDAFVSSAASPFFKERVPVVQEPEGRWGGGEEPSQASWRWSREDLCAQQRGES